MNNLKFILFISIFLTHSLLAKGIVSTYPAATEILIALGLKEKIVGISNYCQNIDGVKKIGSAISPNLEMIVSLKPDLVVVPEMQDKGKLVKALTEFKIRYILLKIDRLEDIFDSIKKISEVLSEESIANDLITEIRGHLKPIKNSKYQKIGIAIGLGTDTTTKQTNSLSFAGNDTFYNDILLKLNLKNSVEMKGYPKLNLEKIKSLNIERLIVLSISNNNPQLELLKKMNPSIKKIDIIKGENLLIPGPHIVKKLKRVISNE